MTRFDDKRLDGRHPEFARMSNGGASGRGGLGREYMFALADSLLKHGLHKDRDVKSFGRYLNNQLDKALGVVERPKGLTSRMRKYDVHEKVSDLRTLQVVAAANGTSFKQEVLDAFEGKRASALARARVYRQRRTV